jgi:catechol 2,3-dioxygenase-like lactoylglutathione lyase family enzyme
VKFDCFFYYVSDLDRSIRFFSDVLGLSLSSRDDVARFLIDGVLFELVPTSDLSQLSGSGNGRLTFEVPDIRAAVQKLESKGVLVRPAHQVSNGFLAAFNDPDGNEFALWQYLRHPPSSGTSTPT